MLFQPRTYKETSRPGTNEVARALSGRRLLFVINDLDFFISHRLPIARAARQAGMEVAVAAAPGLAATRLQAEGIGFHPVPVTRSGAHPRKELRVIWRLYRLFRSWRPDLIHAVTIKGCYMRALLRVSRMLRRWSALSPGWGTSSSNKEWAPRWPGG